MTALRIRQFRYFHHLFAFALALWISFIVLRTFEVISLVQSNTVGAHMLSFISGFWSDLVIVFLLVIILGIASFLVSLINFRAMEIFSAIVGGLIVLFTSLLTFHSIQTRSLLSRFDLGEGHGWLDAIGVTVQHLASFPNILFLLIVITIFALIYFRTSGLNNVQTLVLSLVGVFVFGLLPPVTSWFKMKPEMRVVASNKPQFFFEKRYEGEAFGKNEEASILAKLDAQIASSTTENHNPNNDTPQQSVQQASLFSGIGTSAEGSTVPAKTKASDVFLTKKERTYLFEASLASLSSSILFDRTKVLAYKGKFFEAESIAKFLIIRQGDNADFRLIYGLILGWQQKFDAAFEQYHVGLDLAPKYDEFYMAMADIHTWKQDKTKAIHILDSGITMVDNPDRLYAKKETLQLR